MKPGIFLASIVAALLAGGLLGYGVSSKPAKIEYREHEVIKYRDREQTNVKVATVSAPVVKTIYRDRTVTVPGGTVTVEHWREREDKGPVTTTAEEQTVIIREVDKVRDVLRIETRAPDWLIAILAGTDKSLGKEAAIVVSYHVAGPFAAIAEVVVPVQHPEDAAVFAGVGATF